MRKLIYICSFLFLCFGCSRSSGDINLEENPDEVDEVLNPESELKVTLQFPHKDGLCNLGTDITPTHSTVFFEWEASTVATNYTIYIEDLVSGDKTQDQTTQDKIGIVLKRATPYAWYIESTDGSKTEKSETWKFYNAGPGVQTYAPFPAVIDYPTMAATINTTSVTLQWTGSDVDNDISSYDVYLGTNNDPTIHTTDITANELSVTLNTNTIYFWNVITKDAEGNTSESGIHQFKIE